jgi:hypothetical protein
MSKFSVLIIDNGPIRQRYFSEAQKVIFKIEKFEDKIQTFHTQDQKLFNQWQDLTFRDHRSKHAQAQAKFQELARFHNWVVATAHKLSIEMHRAYVLMREEQIQWNNGDEGVRKQIDQDRDDRDAYIRREMNGRYNESYDSAEDLGDDSADGGLDGLDYFLDRIEEIVLDPDGDHEVLLIAQDRMDRLVDLSDEDLERGLADDEASFLLFDVSLNWGQKHQDYALFRRLWKLMSREQRKYFATVFASVTDASIEELLLEIGLSEDFSDEDTRNSEQDEDEASFNEEYVDQPSRPRPRARDPGTEAAIDTKIKSVFRKLMRKLHPDMHLEVRDGGQPPWVQRIWGLVQKAYGERNVGTLERLLKLTQIRMSAFEELTVSELAEARHWLKEDFKALEQESAALKNSWAWGFSTKKNYESLTKKIEKEYDRELRLVMSEVENLQNQHHMLEVLSQRGPRYKPQGRAKPKSRRGGRRSGRSSEREFWSE